jgi:hypothetical protein
MIFTLSKYYLAEKDVMDGACEMCEEKRKFGGKT